MYELLHVLCVIVDQIVGKNIRTHTLSSKNTFSYVSLLVVKVHCGRFITFEDISTFRATCLIVSGILIIHVLYCASPYCLILHILLGANILPTMMEYCFIIISNCHIY